MKAPASRKAALNKRLDQIRGRGYDEGPSDTLSGVIDICFPLFDHMDVVGALNIVYLKQRDARVTVAQARNRLRQTAQTISRSLGWSPTRRT